MSVCVCLCVSVRVCVFVCLLCLCLCLSLSFQSLFSLPALPAPELRHCQCNRRNSERMRHRDHGHLLSPGLLRILLLVLPLLLLRVLLLLWLCRLRRLHSAVSRGIGCWGCVLPLRGRRWCRSKPHLARAACMQAGEAMQSHARTHVHTHTHTHTYTHIHTHIHTHAQAISSLGSEAK